MFHVSHLRCAPPPGPDSGGIVDLPVFRADTKLWMTIMVRAMNDGLILSINELSLISIFRIP
jgi:hypothetical protein